MTTRAQNRHTRRLVFRRGPVIVLLVLTAVVAAVVTVAAAAPTRSSSQSATGFGWPVKPFHRPHPLRSSFGDPRTIFSVPPTMRGLMSGGGTFSFHQGIDVYGPNGTAVYPVKSGTVTSVERTHERAQVVVTSAGGWEFEYWHISPAVAVGQQVDAYHSVLGRILRPYMHVHLTVVEDGVVVNPLAPGRLTPFADHTHPRVTAIMFRRGGHELFPSFLRGRLELVAEAGDISQLRIPGIWRNLPLTPAVITWRIQRWGGKVVRRGVARDVRESLPPDESFWSHYARGTFQNMSVFGRHYSWLQGGRYLFRLTPQPFDTRRLKDGVYELVVTARDMRGNRGSLSERFTVHNQRGWR